MQQQPQMPDGLAERAFGMLSDSTRAVAWNVISEDISENLEGGVSAQTIRNHLKDAQRPHQGLDWTRVNVVGRWPLVAAGYRQVYVMDNQG